MAAPKRGEVWQIDLEPVRGHEQGGKRPCLIVSVDLFNSGPAGLVVILPLTSKAKRQPFHVEVVPPEGGLTSRSYIKCEDVRSVSTDRLAHLWGAVTSRTLVEVERRLRILLGI